MGKQILIALLATLMPAMAVAQDDMYFVPTKANVNKSSYDYGLPSGTYYSGSNRDIDEYNRRGSYIQQIDSAGNDIITFDAVSGVYPDSLSDVQTDYECARRMSRFDDYSWTDPYWAGYYAGRSDYWGWNDPWFYSSWYYSPWHYGWGYDPWYWGWGGWHGSWWGYPGGWWGYPNYIVTTGRPTGTFNHIRGTGRRPLAGYGGNGTGLTGRTTGGRFGNTRTGNGRFNASERFGTSRSNTNRSTVRTNTPQQNQSSFNRSSSFGGSRSGGSFSGGSRSAGGRSGGGFGGRR